MGGDLEHTHLVKGLDYALLQKIRSEQDKNNDEGEDEDDMQEDKERDLNVKIKNLKEEVEGSDEDEEQEMPIDEKIKLNLKPKILTKNNTAALAAVLNKSLTDNPFAFKKYFF